MISQKNLEYIIDGAMDRYRNTKVIRAIYSDIDKYIAVEVIRYLIANGVEVE